MKHLIQLSIALSLCIQSFSFSQTEQTLSVSSNATTIAQEEAKEEPKGDMSAYNSFIGVYLLEEASFTLEIKAEDGKMYIITEFSKDILIPKNKTTLHEITRGVDLSLIDGNKNALKFSQNGYVTDIKRVKSEVKE